MNASRTINVIGRGAFLSSRARRLGLPLAIGLAAAMFGAAPAAAQVLTISDDDFSDQQGFKGWHYGYFDGSSDTPWRLDDFAPLPFFDDAWRRETGVGGYWTAVTRAGGHPNGLISSGGRLEEENCAVRRWVADADYVLQLSGRLWDADPTPGHGNGVIGHIMVDGETIWQQTIDNGNQAGVEYALEVCTVEGTIIDFAIDPRDSDDGCDDTGFISMIRTIIDHDPVDSFTCTGGTVELNVVTIPGEFTYQWRHNEQGIEHDADGPRLRIVDMDPEKTGFYDCVVTNSCGSMISGAALVTICDADFDCDGRLDSRDFFTFLEHFFADMPRADYNHDGHTNSQDFFDYLRDFFAGC